VYDRSHSLPDGTMRVSGVLIGGERAWVYGSGDVCKCSPCATRGAGACALISD
jgi:S-adenosylhomocysteine hydrolase